jgi:flagellar basal body-associated protein FliL
MRPRYHSRLIIVILVFLILLALMVFTGLMLILMYGGGESDLGPLEEVVRSGGELAYSVVTILGEGVVNLLKAIGEIFPG